MPIVPSMLETPELQEFGCSPSLRAKLDALAATYQHSDPRKRTPPVPPIPPVVMEVFVEAAEASTLRETSLFQSIFQPLVDQLLQNIAVDNQNSTDTTDTTTSTNNNTDTDSNTNDIENDISDDNSSDTSDDSSDDDDDEPKHVSKRRRRQTDKGGRKNHKAGSVSRKAASRFVSNKTAPSGFRVAEERRLRAEKNSQITTSSSGSIASSLLSGCLPYGRDFLPLEAHLLRYVVPQIRKTRAESKGRGRTKQPGLLIDWDGVHRIYQTFATWSFSEDCTHPYIKRQIRGKTRDILQQRWNIMQQEIEHFPGHISHSGPEPNPRTFTPHQLLNHLSNLRDIHWPASSNAENENDDENDSNDDNNNDNNNDTNNDDTNDNNNNDDDDDLLKF